MTDVHKIPTGHYRLHNGMIGSEYDALVEVIDIWTQRKSEAEEKIEFYKARLSTAKHELGDEPET